MAAAGAATASGLAGLRKSAFEGALNSGERGALSRVMAEAGASPGSKGGGESSEDGDVLVGT